MIQHCTGRAGAHLTAAVFDSQEKRRAIPEEQGCSICGNLLIDQRGLGGQQAAAKRQVGFSDRPGKRRCQAGLIHGASWLCESARDTRCSLQVCMAMHGENATSHPSNPRKRSSSAHAAAPHEYINMRTQRTPQLRP